MPAGRASPGAPRRGAGLDFRPAKDTPRPGTALSNSAEKGAALRATLSVGDIAPVCALPDRDGVLVDLRGDAIAGNPIFYPRLTSAATQLIDDHVARLAPIDAIVARAFAVTLSDAKEPAWGDVPFPVLRDANGSVFRAFAADTGDRPTTMVLRAEPSRCRHREIAATNACR